MLTLEKQRDGAIKEERLCTLYDSGFSHKRICSNDKRNPDYLVHCCYYNMCNVDADIFFETQRPAEQEEEGSSK